MKNFVTFLGPVGATFSHKAFDVLAGIHRVPYTNSSNTAEYIPASSNREILKMISVHKGYGALAMETLAGGRVTEPLESFIELLQMYKSQKDCPLHIAGAVGLQLHFSLMTRSGIVKSDIRAIVAHPKAFGACKQNVAMLNVPTESVSSNGEAARLVAENTDYATCAALGPTSAATMYGLKVHETAFEDETAVTTFFLITPTTHPILIGNENRILIVYEVPHIPGALVKSLLPFEEEGLNLIQIHSVHTGNHTYNFAIELEVKEQKFEALNSALVKFEKHVTHQLSFGPFQVLQK